jgi:hypothetical protein
MDWDFEDTYDPTLGKYILFQDGTIVVDEGERKEHFQILDAAGRQFAEVESLGYVWPDRVKPSPGFPHPQNEQAVMSEWDKHLAESPEALRRRRRGYSSVKVGTRLRKDFLLAQGLRIAQADVLDWTEGQNGKGWLLTDGTVLTWNVDMAGRSGGPHHADALESYRDAEDGDTMWQEEIDAGAKPFYIKPDGRVVGVLELDETDKNTLILAGLQPTDQYYWTYDGGQWNWENNIETDEWHFGSNDPHNVTWEKGTAGKAFVLDDGSVWAWNVTEWGAPRHENIAFNNNIPLRRLMAYVGIKPDGRVVDYGIPEREGEYTPANLLRIAAEAIGGYTDQYEEWSFKSAVSTPGVEWVGEGEPWKWNMQEGHSFWYVPDDAMVVIGTSEMHHHDIAAFIDFGKRKKAAWVHPAGIEFEENEGWTNEEKRAVEQAFSLKEAPFQGWDFASLSKVAALTRSQLEKKQEYFHQQFGPDNSEVVHRFDDGWTINKLTTPHNECYEGELMGNCVGSAKSLANAVKPADWHTPDTTEYVYHSIRDPQNIPHGTFVHSPNDTSYWDLDLEGRSGSNAGKYAPYVHDWWTQQGGKPAEPEDWEYEYGMGMIKPGSPEHQAQATDTFRDYKGRGFWGGEFPDYLPQHLKRAVKFLRWADQETESGRAIDEVETELRARLSKNFKAEDVQRLAEDWVKDRHEWKKYQDDQIRPVHRTELPEFYWMHGSYGPEVYSVIKQVNEMYRAIHWNHPNVFKQGLINQLVSEADVDPSQAEEIAERWASAHRQAKGIEEQPPLVEHKPDPKRIEKALDVFGAPPESREEIRKRLENQLTEHKPDPDWYPKRPTEPPLAVA